MRILVSDKLADEGLAILRGESGAEVDVKTGLPPEELKAIIGQYDGICIRSETKLTADVLANPGFHQVFFYGNYRQHLLDFARLMNFETAG